MINGDPLPLCPKHTETFHRDAQTKQILGGIKLNHVLALDKINLANKDVVVASKELGTTKKAKK
jgi:hypothetical protein